MTNEVEEKEVMDARTAELLNQQTSILEGQNPSDSIEGSIIATEEAIEHNLQSVGGSIDDTAARLDNLSSRTDGATQQGEQDLTQYSPEVLAAAERFNTDPSKINQADVEKHQDLEQQESEDLKKAGAVVAGAIVGGAFLKLSEQIGEQQAVALTTTLSHTDGLGATGITEFSCTECENGINDAKLRSTPMAPGQNQEQYLG